MFIFLKRFFDWFFAKVEVILHKKSIEADIILNYCIFPVESFGELSKKLPLIRLSVHYGEALVVRAAVSPDVDLLMEPLKLGVLYIVGYEKHHRWIVNKIKEPFNGEFVSVVVHWQDWVVDHGPLFHLFLLNKVLNHLFGIDKRPQLAGYEVCVQAKELKLIFAK